MGFLQNSTTFVAKMVYLNRATGEMPDKVTIYISSSKNRSRTRKILKIFHNYRKHLCVLYHAKIHSNSPKNHKVTAIYTLGDPIH